MPEVSPLSVSGRLRVEPQPLPSTPRQAKEQQANGTMGGGVIRINNARKLERAFGIWVIYRQYVLINSREIVFFSRKPYIFAWVKHAYSRFEHLKWMEKQVVLC